MKLTCYEISSASIDVRPSMLRREWMDATQNALAYRCLPLLSANTHGWEILVAHGFSAVWNGDTGASDIEIKAGESGEAGEDQKAPQGAIEVATHFGSGLLTFVPSVIMRTEPGYNLWVTGPVNRFKDGIQPLSALIETDWMPYTFTMSWRFTRPGQEIRFERGEPYCFFFPVKRGVVDSCEPEIASVDTNHDLSNAFDTAYSLRASAAEAKRGVGGNLKERIKAGNWYMRGVCPVEGHQVPGHQTKIVASPFRRANPQAKKR